MDAIDWSVWGPPLLVLALGLVGGLGFAAWARQGAPVDIRRQNPRPPTRGRQRPSSRALPDRAGPRAQPIRPRISCGLRS